jgi:hypothetical protein
MGSLADFVGMSKSPRRLGEVKNSITVSEAVVAVPFVEESNGRYFFTIDPHMIDVALGENSYSMADGSDVPGQTIEKLVTQMEKYIFPPTFDFVKNRSQDAIAMYVFEFNMTFDKDDLSYMWQNLMPTKAKSFTTSTSTVHHPLVINELMGYANSKNNKPMKDRVKWMVFKVKQRASTNYYDKVIATTPELDRLSKISRSQQVQLGSTEESTYSYNWPYDYFSIVEMAKIDSTVEFSKLPSNISDLVKIGGSGGIPSKAGGFSKSNIPGQTPSGQILNPNWVAGTAAAAQSTAGSTGINKLDVLSKGPIGSKFVNPPVTINTGLKSSELVTDMREAVINNLISPVGTSSDYVDYGEQIAKHAMGSFDSTLNQTFDPTVVSETFINDYTNTSYGINQTTDLTSQGSSPISNYDQGTFNATTNTVNYSTSDLGLDTSTTTGLNQFNNFVSSMVTNYGSYGY